MRERTLRFAIWLAIAQIVLSASLIMRSIWLYCGTMVAH